VNKEDKKPKSTKNEGKADEEGTEKKHEKKGRDLFLTY